MKCQWRTTRRDSIPALTRMFCTLFARTVLIRCHSLFICVITCTDKNRLCCLSPGRALPLRCRFFAQLLLLSCLTLSFSLAAVLPLILPRACRWLDSLLRSSFLSLSTPLASLLPFSCLSFAVLSQSVTLSCLSLASCLPSPCLSVTSLLPVSVPFLDSSLLRACPSSVCFPLASVLPLSCACRRVVIASLAVYHRLHSVIGSSDGIPYFEAPLTPLPHVSSSCTPPWRTCGRILQSTPNLVPAGHTALMHL
jgi:hypothetical protein